MELLAFLVVLLAIAAIAGVVWLHFGPQHQGRADRRRRLFGSPQPAHRKRPRWRSGAYAHGNAHVVSLPSSAAGDAVQTLSRR